MGYTEGWKTVRPDANSWDESGVGSAGWLRRAGLTLWKDHPEPDDGRQSYAGA